MDFVRKMVRVFLRLRKQARRYRAALVGAMCLVVFATTYALILPAITLNQDAAEDEPGIELADVDATDTAREIVSTSEATDADEPEASEEAASEKPQLIDEATTLSYAGDGYRVEADVDADAELPKGAKLESREITEGKDAEAYAAYAKKALSALRGEDDSIASLAQARFFDIGFVNKAGEQVEPKSDVQVNLRYDDAAAVENGANVKVVHFGDDGGVEIVDGNKTKVSAAKGQLKRVRFAAASFSVYGIVETSDTTKDKTYRRTYTFQNDDGSDYSFTLNPNPSGEGKSGKSTNQQIVKNGDTLQDVGVPEAKASGYEGHEFLGWGVVTGEGESATVDKANLIKLPLTVSGIGTSDESVTLRAVFSSNVNVVFHDDNGATLTVEHENAKPGEELDLSAYKPEMRITRDGDTYTFVGWSTKKRSERNPDTEGLISNNKYTVPNEDSHLYPVYAVGYWLNFDGNDGAVDENGATIDPTEASFTEPKFITGASVSSSDTPDDPTRDGYTFAGWYTDSACTNEFKFTETLSDNTTLYAKWTPESVNYRIAFWVGGYNNPDLYSYFGTTTQTGTAGKMTSYAVSETDYPEAFKEIASYVTRNTTNHAIAQSRIHGDGSTVINVYYDRKTYKLRFYYAFSSVGDDGNVKYGVPTKVSKFSDADENATIEDALKAQIEAKDDGLGEGKADNDTAQQVESLPAASSSNSGTGTTVVTYGDVGYTFYYFDIKARYGQNISASWPAQSFKEYSNTTGYFASDHTYTTLKFVSWGTRSGSQYYANHDNKNIKGPYSTLDSSLIINPDQEVAQCFLAYWNNPNTYTYKIYYTLLTGDQADYAEGNEGYYTYDNVPYKLVGTYSIGATSSTQEQNSLTFEGVESVNSKPIETSGYDVTFLYKRKLHTFTFLKTDGNPIAKEQNIAYGEPLQAATSADDESQFPNQHWTEAQNAADAGYTFVGWYKDPEGTDPFDFSGSMPDGDFALYAKYERKKCSVTFDASGGTLASGQDDSVTVDYGGTVANQESKLGQTTREGYELVGWYKVNDDGTESPYGFSTQVTEDTTLKAHWRLLGTYGVRYMNSDPSTGNATSVLKTDASEYDDGAYVPVLSGPGSSDIPEGYEFVGWADSSNTYYPDREFKLDASSSDVVMEGDKKYYTLKAVYTKLGTTYVSYDANGGSGTLTDLGTSGSGNAQVDLAPNSAVKLSGGAGFTREGYVLVGWNTKAAANGDDSYASTRYALGDTYGVDDENGNTLYAEWKQTTPPENYLTVQKTFSGIDASQVPNNFSMTVTNTADSAKSYTLTSTNYSCAKSTDGLTWTWKIDNADVGTYTVSESGQSVSGYSVTTMPSLPDASYEVKAANLTITSDETQYHPNNNKTFTVGSSTIFIASLTSNSGSVVITKDPLNASTRKAISDYIGTMKGSFKNDNVYFYDATTQGSSFTTPAGTVSNVSSGDTNTITFDKTSTWSQAATATADLATAAKTPDISITNNYTRSVSIAKQDNSGTPLAGAKFELKQGSEAVEGGSFTSVMTAKTLSLPNGTYQLTETAAPTGYIITDGDVYFTVSGSGVTLTDASGAEATYASASASGDTITIKNTPGTALPSTGGDGNWRFGAFGVALIAVGLALALVSRRRVNKSDSHF